MNPHLRVALYGPSGAGKTTFSDLLSCTLNERGLFPICIQIAKPLYLVQDYIYTLAGHPLTTKELQDTELLSYLGHHFRRIDPNSLLLQFEKELESSIVHAQTLGETKTAIICPDARTPDLPRLKELGFVSVFVSAPASSIRKRLLGRGDITRSKRNLRIEVDYSDWPWDSCVDNSGTVGQLRHTAVKLAGRLTTT